MTAPIISVIGWHDAGKTTFIVRLVAELKRRGLRVATIKHSRGHFEIDRPGTDTWRLAQAGSDVVVISGKHRMALIEQSADELSLNEIVARLPGDIDLVITEGYKSLPTPKIEVARAGAGEGRVAASGELLALVTDELDAAEDGVPCFAPTDVAGVVDLLAARGFVEPREG
jgi:molybdopterin-guanine dinucleotide biosynthesis protein B